METMLSLKGIDKYFQAVHALKKIDLEVFQGETLALVGENGAGKSTLVKILTGAHRKDTGTIELNGQTVEISSPIHAKRLGIYQAYQRAEYVPELSVAENIFLGERDYTKNGFVSWRKIYDEAQESLKEYGLDIDGHLRMKDLSVAQCQLITIVKMLRQNPKLVIFDEPTAVLSDNEVDILFRIIRKIQKEGVTIIYISHRLDEIFKISDRIAVMRDGNMVTVLENKNLSQQELVDYMLGRKLETMFPEKVQGPFLEEGLRIEGFSNENVKDISFDVKKGEILGIVGLVGSKRTELARAIYGIDRVKSGELYLEGKKIEIHSPYDAIKQGIFLAPEDRKGEGIVPERSIKENMTYSDMSRFFRLGFVEKRKENDYAESIKDQIRIKAPSIDTLCRQLSGGNQQKVVVAKALTSNPKVLIFDEPTQGIDVGAKAEIYELIHDLAKKGTAVIVISSEAEEAIGISNRLLVMREGKVSGMLEAEDMVSQNILNLMYRSN
ncbi:MAG: sugar ABC transporter ATP-binding protein [Eubacteriales bacterium]|nr:sugar ABC transporter ATP-binding protein [Eubacteriales bacterium]